MINPGHDAGQRWSQFFKTGSPEDYLAYRAAKNRRNRGIPSPIPHDPLP